MKHSQLLSYSFRVQFVYSADILMSVIKDLYTSISCNEEERKQLKSLYRLLKTMNAHNEREINLAFSGCENDVDPNDIDSELDENEQDEPVTEPGLKDEPELASDTVGIETAHNIVTLNTNHADTAQTINSAPKRPASNARREKLKLKKRSRGSRR